jgi:alpha-1,6-mannosyltransferase
MPPKTLHLTNSWHERSGGIATFYRALIDEANRQGRHIRLIVPGEKDHVEEAGEFGKIYHVKAPLAPFNSQYRIIYPTQFLWPGSKLERILIGERPDLVEICDKYTLNYLGALLRRGLLPALDFRPAVVGLSCERMDDNFRIYVGNLPLARKLCAAYLKWAYFPFFDHHIANSEYTAEELRQASRGHLTSRNTWIRPMGVNLQNLSPARRSREIRQRILRDCAGRDSSILLLYAGRLVPEKNLDLLFHSLALLTRLDNRDYRLLIAGDGMERTRWESLCQKNIPGRVTFLGHIADSIQLADLLANADAFIHPNPREPFGIAPLQAMASGLPLVAPNSGGITTYANSENAWLVSPDAASFVSAIQDLLANDSLRIQRAQHALRTAQEFRWEKVAASFLELYSELCAMGSNQAENSLAPNFSSAEAEGWELVFSRKISAAAERIFRFATMHLDRFRRFSRSESGSLQVPTSDKNRCI